MQQMNSEYFLIASDLGFYYGCREILKNVDIVLKKGKMYSVIGPNGSGKTTLIKCLNKNLIPNQGKIHLFGQDLSNMKTSEIARRIAYMPQRTAIDFDFSVQDVVMMGRHEMIGRWSRESLEDIEACQEAMELCGVSELRKRSVNTLSGGEIQKVILARCIAQDTDLLLLDEPLTYLDVSNQLEFLKIIRELIRVKQVTVVAVIHDINLAYQYSDYVYVLKDGGVIAEGKPEEVMTKETLKECFKISVHMLDNPNGGRKIIAPAESRDL